MLVESREVLLVDVPELVVFDERYKNPKCDLLAAVVQQRSHHEVHPLHVPDTLVVSRKRHQYSLQTFKSFFALELGAFGERSLQVFLNLILIVAEELALSELEVELAHLVKLPVVELAALALLPLSYLSQPLLSPAAHVRLAVNPWAAACKVILLRFFVSHRCNGC